MLSAADEMEVKQRTEEQIRARVKKLGLTAARPDRPMEGGGNSDDDADKGSDDGNAEEGLPASGEENNAMEDRVDNPGSAKPFNVRKLKRKNQAESDDDSEGLFSSTEVGKHRFSKSRLNLFLHSMVQLKAHKMDCHQVLVFVKTSTSL